MEESNVIVKRKLGIVPKIFLFIFVFVLLLFSYMSFIEPKIIITREYAIVDSEIPDSFNGFKIAHFSDIHFGRTTNEKEVSKVVSLILETKPDIVIFSGDLFDSSINLSEKNIVFLKEQLSKIEATIGKYALFGDSDYINEEAYKTIMTEAGFTLLDHLNIPIFYQSNVPIYLSGISSISYNTPDFDKAFKKELDGDYYQIFICHEPALFSELTTKVDLMLSGHSLGGLIRFPYLGGIIEKDNVLDYEFGNYRNNEANLYVSNGIGTEDISLRFLNYPSISLYRLYNYE